jgi:hypothetical protein
MTRARASSRRPAKHPVAATPGASLPLDASLLSIVANLEGLDLNGLRGQWRAHLGGDAPAHLSRWLLMKVLGYRLQSDASGDLDKSIRRILRSEKDEDAAVPFDRRSPQTQDGVGLKAGALLVREWNGKLERVMILEEGFAWNGKTFRQPVPDRQGDDRDQMERPSLLRASPGKDGPGRRGRRSPREQK